MPQDFNLHRGISSSTGWCILWFSGDGNLNPTNSPISHGGQTGHSFVGYSDLWKWFICHWHYSCDVAIFIFTPATALNAQPSTGRPVDGLDCLIAASSMLQPSALTRNDQPFVGQAGPQFQQNLFHRLLVSTSICAIHCLQNCSLKSLSHSFSSTIIFLDIAGKKNVSPNWGHCKLVGLTVVTHFPQRWSDLLQYQLLILCTHQHVIGWVWMAYDKALREPVAATNLMNWPCMNVQLFKF